MALLVVVWSLAFAATAGGVDPGGARVGQQSGLVRAVTIPVTVEGSVQVEFASGATTGCELQCGVSGSLTWDPTGQADLAVNQYRTRGKGELEASLFFFGGLGQDAPRTTAHVVRKGPGPGGVCSDARVNELTFLDFSAGSRSHVEVRLVRDQPGNSNLFRSRCGGPLERDLAAAMPSATVDRATLRKGGATVDLSATRPFAAHGFAGTVRSSIKLRLGRAREEPPAPRLGAPRRPPSYAPRTVIAVYRVEQVAGMIVTGFTGTTERSLCEPLDACGASGTVRLSPLVSSGRAAFVAYGPARRVSGRELRSALGLRPGPRVSGIQTSGVADWTRDGGSVAESFLNGDGASCNDSVPLAGGFMTFWVGTRRVFVSYGGASGAVPDLLRTHCPGPSILDAAQNRPLASGSVSRRAFRKRRVVLTLSHGRPFESEPYAGETRPALKIVLERVRVRETLSVPGGV